MSPTQEKILEGEALHFKHSKLLMILTVALEVMGKDNSATPVNIALSALLNVEKMKYEESTAQIDARLNEMRKRHLAEFEKDSMEVNQKMEEAISGAKKYIGKDPVGVSCKIGGVIAKIGSSKFIEQEEKNDLYFELKSYIKFFKEKVKR